MTRKRIVQVLAALAGLTVLAAAAAILFLVTADLRPLIEDRASAALQRKVSAERLTIAWGNPIRLEIRTLRIANTAWGSVPDMIGIEHLAALIEVGPLFRGVLRYRDLKIAGSAIVLERGPDGRGNWHFGDAPAAEQPAKVPSGGLAVVPKNRSQFPTLIDFGLKDGFVSYRSSSGKTLRVDLGSLAIASPDDHSPVRISLEGAYNGTAATLAGVTGSFATLRDAAIPYETKLTLTTGSARADLDGTMREPLDFEGVQGPLTIAAGALGDIVHFFGGALDIPLPLTITGALTHDGKVWTLAEARGDLAASVFTGTLTLTEGGRGQPDDVAAALDFPRLDLKPIVAGLSKDAAPTDASASLDQSQPGRTNVEARVTAARVDYGAVRAADMILRGRLAAGEVALDELGFVLAGGKVAASATARARGEESDISASATLSRADANLFAQWIGAGNGELVGSVSGGAAVTMRGTDLKAAMGTADGHATLAMTGGRVARDLIEKATADLRTLFRDGEGTVQLTCLLAVLDIRRGVGTLAPLRLRTPEASLAAAGYVDLAGGRIDMILETEAKSLFALELPIRISGPFADIAVKPSAAALVMKSPDGGGAMPAEMKRLVDGNSCRR